MQLNMGAGAGEVDETSPDMLKNTPSNIRRLANEIDRCEGRQKYLARTNSPSDGGDVRWYFCKVPLAVNELAASIPQTEIVGKGDYFRFGMRDSLAVEASFLQREDELLSSWWKEFAECSEGPRGQSRIISSSNIQMKHLSSESSKWKRYATEEDRVGVPVKGGLYEYILKTNRGSGNLTSGIRARCPVLNQLYRWLHIFESLCFPEMIMKKRMNNPVAGMIINYFYAALDQNQLRVTYHQENEVDLAKRHCFPVYWNGENRRVLRGHWFARKGGLDWLPLREDVSEQLEYAYRSQVWHRRTFQPSGLFAARVDLQGSTLGLHALFTGEDDTWESWLNVDASGISSVVGFGGNGIKLRRGYASPQSKKPTQDELRQEKEEEMDDYCSQVPVRHLVFVIHGIGQRLEKSNLVDDVATHRHVTERLAERHLTSHQRGTQRVIFIPCQWRKGLTLGGEASVEKITLDGVRGLRTMLSATVHDILYYMSPVHCQDIIDSVSNQLNRLYLKFLKRNPGYDGKVSLYGHSLGSVLAYDILCHQEKLYSNFPMEWMYKERRNEANCSIRNNISSDCNFMSNMGDERSENVEFESIVGHVDNQDIVEESMQGSCIPLGPPALSVSDESNTTDIDYQKTNDALSSDGNVNESFGNSNLMGFYKSYMVDEPNIMSSEVVLCDGDKDDEDIFDNDKDEAIKLMKEEIRLLKAKAKKLEAECADDELPKNAKKTTAAVSQSDYKSVQPELEDSSNSCTPLIRHTKLEFEVDTFFAVGSPLGVFLSLRNVRIGIGEGKDYWGEENINEEMPACQRMFNIFHPYDPVAYRIEPLICKEFIHKRAVIIPYYRGGKRLYVGFQEFKEGLASHSKAMMDHMSAMQVKVLTLCQSRSENDHDEEYEHIQEKEERSYGSKMMEKLTGSEDGQIDHVLQDKTFRHPYISAIGAHTNYWSDKDTVLFMLKHLYRDIPDEPYLPSEQHQKDESIIKGWSDPRELADEELPLTFGDTVLIKKFSQTAKRVMRS